MNLKLLSASVLLMASIAAHGQSWTAQNSNVSVLLQSISMANAQIGWAFGESGEVISTADGGNTWTPKILSPNYVFHTSWVFNDSTILGAGEHDTEEGFVIISQDGGTTWFRDSITFLERINDVSFVDNLKGWAVGRDGYLIRTTDGGFNWTPQSPGTPERLFGVHFVDQNTGWIVGKNGALRKTTNGGVSWVSQSPVNEDFESVFFRNLNTGWVIAGNLIFHTSNGGQTWTQQTSGTQSELFDITFVTDSVGWVCGEGGTLLHTVNGGQTWSPQSSATTEDIFSLSMLSPFSGWLSGDQGAISRYSGGGAIAASFVTEEKICLGDTSFFTDLSTGTIQSWAWDFGDGNTSVQNNPVHLFSSAGRYVVNLIVTNTNGTPDTLDKAVTVYDLPTASITPTADTLWLPSNSVSFFASGMNATDWFWDFGNGDTASNRNPSTQYTQPGTYPVTLVVSNGPCLDSVTIDIVVLQLTGIEDRLLTDLNVSIYPNPIDKVAAIRLENGKGEAFYLEVFDLNGKRMLSEFFPLDNHIYLQATTWKQGCYICKITGEDSRYVIEKIFVY